MFYVKKFFVLFALLFSIISHALTAKAPLKVSLIMPASGYFSKMGVGLYQGLLAAEELFPELKSQVELKWVPSTESIAVLATDTEKNIQEFKPDLIIGGVTSLQAMTISEISEKYNIPFIAPYATNPHLTESKKQTFTLCFNDNDQAQSFAKILLKEHIKEVAILYSVGDLYSEYLKDNFSKYAKENGIKVVDVAGVNPANKTEEVFITNLAKHKYKAYFMPFYQMSARTLLKQLLKVTPESTVFFGTDSWAVDSGFVDEFKENGGSRRAIYVDHWNSKGNTDLHKRFNKLRENPPANLDVNSLKNTGSALGVDLGLLLKELVKNKDYSQLAQKIKKVSFTGLAGKTSYRNQFVPQKDIHFFEINSKGSKFLRSIPSL